MSIVEVDSLQVGRALYLVLCKEKHVNRVSIASAGSLQVGRVISLILLLFLSCNLLNNFLVELLITLCSD